MRRGVRDSGGLEVYGIFDAVEAVKTQYENAAASEAAWGGGSDGERVGTDGSIFPIATQARGFRPLRRGGIPCLLIGTRREDRVNSLLVSKPSLDFLTTAETRVLKLIAEDRTSKEIAELLKISTKTVDNHRHNICRKLNIYGSHSLLKFAFDHKFFL